MPSSASRSGATYSRRRLRFLTASSRRAGFLAAVAGVERARRDAETLELRHLVTHQRDQRRDDDGEPVAQKRGQLIAERLAAAGRHHREHVPALKDRGDNIPLSRAEIREPKVLRSVSRASFNTAIACDLHDVPPRWKVQRSGFSRPAGDYTQPTAA